ncbi:uncharacterized protein LOC143894210 isoform X3 [Temnothorax americanus]|uniref:uncharacterized protein LOC143894210 isoform X3 n=1 Tax=Temnothorax americanus TaxID=1964332 RepID=UPI0040686FC4
MHKLIKLELHSNHENGAFYPLDETHNLENNTRNRQNTIKYYQDNVPIMVIEGNKQNDFWKRKDISPIRRFGLFVSILLCIITIVIFLYVLPCDSSMVCSSIIESHSPISWDKTLEDVEIYGPITVVPGSPYNLIFLLHGEQYKKNDIRDKIIHQRQIPPDGGGVISMQGNSGLPLWLVPLKRLPTNIDCTSIDIDQSGKPDCIVAGEQGLLISIEPIAGTIHWSSTTNTFSKLPVIIPDIDADNIEDLLSVAIDNANVSSLVFLSSKTGQLLERYSINDCISIDIYNLVSNGNISYNCYDNNAKRVTRFISLKGLFHKLNITQIHKKFSTKSAALPRLFEIIKSYDDEYSWRPTPYHHLTVENEGVCPGQFCHTNINLTLQRLTNEPITIWDYNIDLLALNENWLNNDERLNIEGFKWITQYKRKDVRAGGVEIYEKNESETMARPHILMKGDGENELRLADADKYGEICAVQAKIDNKKCLLMSVYINPNVSMKNIIDFISRNLHAYSPNVCKLGLILFEIFFRFFISVIRIMLFFHFSFFNLFVFVIQIMLFFHFSFFRFSFFRLFVFKI